MVVGGGVAGCAVALELAERGAAVNLLDPQRLGDEATGASAGMLAPRYESAGAGPLFRLLRTALARFPAFAERLEERSGTALHLRRDGMLVANLDEGEHEEALRTLRWQRAEGEATELLDPSEAARREPGATPEAVSYLWLPDEAQVDAQRLAAALETATAHPRIRRIRRRVAAVTTRGGRVEGVVLADGRRVGAELVVVAAGAWSGTVGGISPPLPVRPVRGHLLRYPAGSARLARLVAGHAGRYLVPRADGTVLAGSTMDDVGFDRSISEAGLARVAAAAGRLVPALARARPMEWWTGLRPLSTDLLPLLGPDPAVQGLHFATGYGRNGILLAGLAAEVVADLALEGSSAVDWSPFSPSRTPSPTPA